MQTLRLFGNAINTRYIDQAVEAMRRGEAIAYPTDTLYAFGCDALQARAVEQICRLKDIDPKRQPLAVTCADLSQAARYARIDNRAYDILRRHLPGPFTFVLPAASTLPKPFKGRREVGIRIPDDPVARALAEGLGGPLLTSSIHLPEDTSEAVAEVATAEIVDAAGSDVAYMLDAGPRGTEPSTVVDLTDSSSPVIIRQGKGIFEE